MRRGLTLVETVLSLVIFLIVVLAGLESFGTARNVFFRLRDAQESRLAALGAIDRIKAEVLQAGRGLGALIRLGLAAGLEETAEGWAFWSAETEAAPESDLVAGQAFIPLSGFGEVAAGRRVALLGGENGEVATVREAGPAGITLASPIGRDYPAARTAVVLLRRAAVYLDEKAAVLRRKVNAAPGQPLLEDVKAFGLAFDPPQRRVTVMFRMKSPAGVCYETTIAAKNLALAGTN